ncbi:MAG TPA: four helix bundle protein [Patescibacteria group bacterium]|nr:four helix bundle protein [Patescibacteria group bacterium]
MFRFETLTIWQDAREFSKDIYFLTKKFPKGEMFSLTNQLRRAVNSIGANIAEGSASSSSKDFAHYLDISVKSLYETIAHLQIAEDQKYICSKDKEVLYEKADILARKIRSFRKTLL